MSNLDPFGSRRTSNGGFAHRKKSDYGAAVFQSADGAVRDVFATVMDRKASGWNRACGILAVANFVLGTAFCLWAFFIMPRMTYRWHALGAGGALIATSLVGMFSVRYDTPTVKTLYLSLSVIVGLLSWAFVIQIGSAAQNECILAETYLRMDHLESVLSQLKHSDMLNGIMTRLDHLHDDIQQVEEHAVDQVKQAQDQVRFKEKDMKFIDERLHNLLDLADDAMYRLDEHAKQLDRNITELENLPEDEQNTETKAAKASYKARLRTLRYRLKTVEPKKTALRDLIARIEGHVESGITPEDYAEVMRVLEKSIMDNDLSSQVQAEKEYLPMIKESSARIQNNSYDSVAEAHYAERSSARAKARKERHDQYMREMEDIMFGHVDKLSDSGKFMQSLDEYLKALPEHCEEDIDTLETANYFCFAAMVAAAASAYVSLTSAVVSSKKDF